MVSNCHMEVCPADVGHDDRVVMQELIKTHASTQVIDSGTGSKIKVVVVMEADRLTREAQQSLRRTMEQYMSTCRIVLIAEQVSRIIPAVRSRTLSIRCPAPDVDTIARLVCDVSEFTGGKQSAILIAKASGRNLRRALLMAETMTMSNSHTPTLPHWQSLIGRMAKKVMEKQTPLGVDELRVDFFQLMAHMIPADLTFEQLMKHLLPLCASEKLRLHLIHAAAFYESRSRLSNKSIIHLEAFVANFMMACKTVV